MLIRTHRAPVIGSRVQSAKLASAGPFAAIATALAFVSLAGCATAEPYNPGQLAPDQLARVGEICQSVLVVRPGEQHFDGCVESLSESLNTARPVSLAPSTPEDGADPSTRASSVSYFYASSGELRRREQLSCARLGLDPASRDAATCVANLAGTFQAMDIPQD